MNSVIKEIKITGSKPVTLIPMSDAHIGHADHDKKLYSSQDCDGAANLLCPVQRLGHIPIVPPPNEFRATRVEKTKRLHTFRVNLSP